MGASALTRTQAAAINYTYVTSGSTDWSGVTGTTYFYDLVDKKPYYKDSNGNVINPFTNIFVTGGTYTAGTATFTNNSGSTFNVTGFTSEDLYIRGTYFDENTYILTLERSDNINLDTDLSILSSDMNVTGGTYNNNTGTATFTNNSGGTFNVTGFLTGFTDIYTTGLTYNNSTNVLTLLKNNDVNYNVNLSKSIGEIYWTGNTTDINIATANVYYGVTANTASLNSYSTGFTKTDSGILTYTGSSSNLFTVTAAITLYNARTSTNDDYSFVIYKNGNPLEDTKQQIMLNGQTSASYNYQSLNLEGICQLTTNDNLEVFVTNNTSNAAAGHPIITNMTLRAIQI